MDTRSHCPNRYSAHATIRSANSRGKAPIFDFVLPLAVIIALAGLCLILLGFSRGEWSLAIPSDPSPHWRLMVGAIALVGGSLVAVATVIAPAVLSAYAVRTSTASLCPIRVQPAAITRTDRIGPR